jgi:hypothetical protein
MDRYFSLSRQFRYRLTWNFALSSFIAALAPPSLLVKSDLLVLKRCR